MIINNNSKTKFKFGDRVKIIAGVQFSGDFYVGQVGTVVEVSALSTNDAIYHLELQSEYLTKPRTVSINESKLEAYAL